MYDELIFMLDEVCDNFDDMANDSGFDMSIFEYNPREAFRLDLALFLMYLSASDGEINWDEAEFISKVMGTDYGPSNFNELIQALNIYSVEFESKVPDTFKFIIDYENVLFDVGYDNSSVSETMIEMYQEFATAFINIDGDEHINEIQDSQIYISMMKDYRKNNSKSLIRGAVGFEGNRRGAVKTPSKGGVRAPKKG